MPAPAVDTHLTRAILDIVESVSTRAHGDEMMAEPGALRTTRIARSFTT